MGDELPFVVCDVGHSPGAHGGLFPPPIVRQGRGGFVVFWGGFVVIVDFDSLAPKFIDVDSPFTDVSNYITGISPAGISFSGHLSSRSLLSTRPGSAIRLARKWRVGGRRHREVELDDVELGSIVDFGDAHDVAPLLPSVDHPLALADNEHVREFALIVVGPLLPDSGARVEESGLSPRAPMPAGRERRTMVVVDLLLWLADSLVWYLWIPTVEGGQVTKNFFFDTSPQSQYARLSMGATIPTSAPPSDSERHGYTTPQHHYRHGRYRFFHIIHDIRRERPHRKNREFIQKP